MRVTLAKMQRTPTKVDVRLCFGKEKNDLVSINDPTQEDPVLISSIGRSSDLQLHLKFCLLVSLRHNGVE